MGIGVSYQRHTVGDEAEGGDQRRGVTVGRLPLQVEAALQRRQPRRQDKLQQGVAGLGERPSCMGSLDRGTDAGGQNFYLGSDDGGSVAGCWIKAS
jgi:hypothetical protein